MGDPVRLLLTNAAAAGLIALVAWAASRVVRRHAVVHGLWLLALLKLVSPPVAPLPLLPSWTASPPAFGPRTPTVAVIPAPLAADARLRSPERTAEHVTLVLPSRTARVLTGPARQGPEPRPAPPATASPLPDWRTAVWTLLASGALAIAALAAWRFQRFGRLLACARPAPSGVAERASALAARLGLRRAPPVLLLPARIPPVLWPHRRGPLLLMPQSLLAELTADELDALLAHELAHVRRRDHWVRLVEVAATALFWWYPVTWWARRALRRAEERCCDEWVMRVLPRSAQAYANGLLKSLTFVAGAPVPAVASGLGPVEDLEARLKEILMTRPVPQLALPLRFALVAAATLGLAVFPTHAQPTVGGDEPAKAVAPGKPAPPAKAAPAAKPATAPATAKPAPPAKPGAPTPPPAKPPEGPTPVVGGVPDGAVGGVPGGVVGGVPGGVVGAVATAAPATPLTPPPALAPMPPGAAMAAPLAAPPAPPGLAPAPALAPMAPGSILQEPLPPTPVAAPAHGQRGAERRAIEDQRRAIEDERRKLQQQEFELQQRQMELEAKAEHAELRAEAERLRAAGRPEDAARLEKHIQLTTRRVELQKRQLELEAERVALEAKLEAEVHAHEERLEAVEEGGHEEAALREAERDLQKRQQAIEQELQQKQQAIEREVAESEKEEQALAAEDQVRAVREATEELARSIAEQIESLEQAAADAPARTLEIDRELQRLKAALDALKAERPRVPSTTGERPRVPSTKAPRP